MQYSAEVRNLAPEYDDCPDLCPALGTKRSEFCESCDRGDARRQYQETVEQGLADLAKEKDRSTKWTFEKLNRCVIDALQFEALPASRRTIVTALMVAILEKERTRIQRVKDWNDKIKAEQDAAAG